MIGALILAALVSAFVLGWIACAAAYRHAQRTLDQEELDFTVAAARGELEDWRRPW